MAQLVKNPPAMQETCVRSLDWEDPLEKGKTTHSSIQAWRIPSTGTGDSYLDLEMFPQFGDANICFLLYCWCLGNCFPNLVIIIIYIHIYKIILLLYYLPSDCNLL